MKNFFLNPLCFSSLYVISRMQSSIRERSSSLTCEDHNHVEQMSQTVLANRRKWLGLYATGVAVSYDELHAPSPWSQVTHDMGEALSMGGRSVSSAVSVSTTNADTNWILRGVKKQ